MKYALRSLWRVARVVLSYAFSNVIVGRGPADDRSGRPPLAGGFGLLTSVLWCDPSPLDSFHDGPPARTHTHTHVVLFYRSDNTRQYDCDLCDVLIVMFARIRTEPLNEKTIRFDSLVKIIVCRLETDTALKFTLWRD